MTCVVSSRTAVHVTETTSMTPRRPSTHVGNMAATTSAAVSSATAAAATGVQLTVHHRTNQSMTNAQRSSAATAVSGAVTAPQ